MTEPQKTGNGWDALAVITFWFFMTAIAISCILGCAYIVTVRAR